MNRNMYRVVTTSLLCLTFLAIPLPVQAQQAAPAVLSAIPADATAFAAIRNLKEVDADIIAMANQLNVQLGPQGIFPGPLDFLKANTGISEGLDENGSLAFVVLSLAKAQSSQDVPQQLVVLIPATDPATLIQAMGGEKDGDVYNVSLMGQPAIAAPKGKHVVVAQSPEAVKAAVGAAGKGVELPPERVKAFSDTDLFVYANLKGISEEIRKEVENTLLGIMMMGNPQAGAQAQNTVEQISKFFKEGEILSGGLTLDPKRGILFSGYVSVREGSEMARQMEAMKGSDTPPLVGLPDEPSIFAIGVGTGMGGTPEAEKQMRQSLDQLLNEENLKEHVDPAQIKQLKDQLVALLGKIQHAGASITSLPSEGNNGLIGAAAVIEVEQNKQWLDQFGKTIDLVKKIVSSVAAKEEGANPEQVKAALDAIQIKSDAEQVGGAAVRHLVVDMEKLPEANPEDIKEVRTVIGQEGFLVRMAPIGEKQVLITFGGGAERFARIAELVAKKGAPLAGNADIKKASQRLPEGQKLAEGYFNVAHLLTLVMAAAEKLDRPIMVPLAMRDSTPIAFSTMKVGPRAQRFDVVVPMELVVSVKELAGPLVGMMMMGGAGDPGMDMEEHSLEPEPDQNGEIK